MHTRHPYDQYEKFHLAVDCIIFGFDSADLKLLCIQRNFPPEQGKWSLMGGFLKKEESIDEAANRVLFELTGLKDIFLEQLMAYGDLERDSAGRVISIAYYALINPNNFQNSIQENMSAKWFKLNKLPKLVFDHNIMVEKALRRLQRKCKSQPVGFELLPERFTLPQLQLLYEKIFKKEYDRRNFRKKILSFEVLERLDAKDKKTSKKGAYLYKFNKEKYDQLMQQGITFEIL